MAIKGSSEQIIDDKWISSKFIPFRWVFASVGIGLGALGTVVIGSFTVGSKVTGLSVATENTDKRVEILERAYDEDRKLLYRIDGKIDTLINRRDDK